MLNFWRKLLLSKIKVFLWGKQPEAEPKLDEARRQQNNLKMAVRGYHLGERFSATEVAPHVLDEM